MSGNDGSIGYSFFSEAEETKTSLNFELLGEEVESDPNDRDLLSGDGDGGGELEFEVAIDTLGLRSPTEPLVARSSSRANFNSWNFGGTTITSTGQ
ncbi:unnamed protein product [Camellia sinensis]